MNNDELSCQQVANARELIVRNQNPSVALVQRHLKIGHHHAQAVLQQLEDDIVSTPDENGWPQMLDTGDRSPEDPKFAKTVDDENTATYPAM